MGSNPSMNRAVPAGLPPNYVVGMPMGAVPKPKKNKKAAAPTSQAESTAEKPAEDKEKRVKNIKKKLRNIQELKIKKEQGAVLDDAQNQKILTEEALVQEMEKLLR
jgi:translation initiation factor 2A